jgi:hypothetical protein
MHPTKDRTGYHPQVRWNPMPASAVTVWGCQRLVTIAVLAVAIGILCGVPLGAISGYFRGTLDAILMRVVDAWFAFPGTLFSLLAATLIRAYELPLFWNTVRLIIALGWHGLPAWLGWCGGQCWSSAKRTTSRPRTPPAGRTCRSPFARSHPTACSQSSSRLPLRWASSC